MLFTCVFGDVSRAKLSKATAESAADLALQSVLAHYDPDLEQFYGLVASCQDIEDFYAKSANYFKGMMQAQGLPEEYSKLFGSFLDQQMSAIAGEDPSNFLKVEATKEITVGNVDNNSLGGNPALLQKSIVEFMKYRAPIGLTEKLLARWSNRTEDGKLKDNSLEGIEINKHSSEVKQEYAEAEGSMLEKVFATYEAIRDYEKYLPGPTREKYEDLEKNSKDLYEELLEATKLVVRYYFADSDTIKNLPDKYFWLITLPEKLSDPLTPAEVVTGKKPEPGKEAEPVELTQAKFTELLALSANIDQSLKQVNTAIENQKNAWDQMNQSFSHVSSAQMNPVVYALAIHENSSKGDRIKRINVETLKLLEWYAQLEGAKLCTPAKDLPEDWSTQLDSQSKKIKTWFEENLDLTEYESATLVEYSNAPWNIYKNKLNWNFGAETRVYSMGLNHQWKGLHNHSYMIDGKYTLKQLTEKIRNQLKVEYDQLGEQQKRLELAINGDGKILPWEHKTPAMDELVEAVRDYEKKRNEWGNEVKGQKTEYQEKEWKEYEEGAVKEEAMLLADVKLNVKEESVTELKTRLTNILDDIKACRTALEGFTYGGKKVMELTEQDIINLVRAEIPSRSSIDYVQNCSEGETVFTKLIQPAAATDLYHAPENKSGKAGNNPILKEDTPVLYQFMLMKFQDKEGEIKDAKKKKDEFDKKQKEKTEAEKKAALEVSDKSNLGHVLPNASNGTPMSVLTSVDTMFTMVKNLASGMDGVKNMRDNLYVTEYIMEMFTHYATQTEGTKRLGYTAEAWDADNKTQVMENQSLTNRHFCLANNHANRAEIEYILYGSGSGDSPDALMEEPIKTAAKNIYEVRLALNTTAGFCVFYTFDSSNATSRFIHSVANAVMSLSQGVIPIPVTKTLMILTLAGLESASDVAALKGGDGVPFYKWKEKQWKNCFDDGQTANPNEPFPRLDYVGNNTPEKAGGELYYSDYMYVFTALAMQSTKVRGAALKRVGDLIEANMRKAGKENFDLNNAKTHFQLTAQLRVKPLMLTLPLVDNNPETGTVDFRERTDWCTYDLKVIRGYS